MTCLGHLRGGLACHLDYPPLAKAHPVGEVGILAGIQGSGRPPPRRGVPVPDILPATMRREEKRYRHCSTRNGSTWYFVLCGTYVDPVAVVNGSLLLAAVGLRAADGSDAAMAWSFSRRSSTGA